MKNFIKTSSFLDVKELNTINDIIDKAINHELNENIKNFAKKQQYIESIDNHLKTLYNCIYDLTDQKITKKEFKEKMKKVTTCGENNRLIGYIRGITRKLSE